MGKMMYDDLKEMLCDELEKIVQKGELSAGSLDAVHKLTDTIKNIEKIEMLDDGEYSQAYDRDYTRTRFARNDYNRGNSYARRDSRGRYSRGGESMRERIMEMMDEPNVSERDKQALKRALDMFN